jgi:DNA primase
LTSDQIELLRRYSQKLTFCFDTDPAGTSAQRKSIQLIENAGIVASVIVLPKGKDPDDLLNSDPIEFKKAVKKDVHIYDFIIDSAISELDPKTADGKRSILGKTIPFLSVIENEVIKEHYLKKLAERLDTSLDSVIREAEKDKSKKETKIVTASVSKVSREDLISQYLFSLILQSSNIIEHLRLVDTLLEGVPLISPAYERLFKLIKSKAEKSAGFALESFVKTLPSELLEAYDTAYISPISEFDPKAYEGELKKIALEEKNLAIKKRLNELTQEIMKLEREKKETEVEKLQEEASMLTGKLSVKTS